MIFIITFTIIITPFNLSFQINLLYEMIILVVWKKYIPHATQIYGPEKSKYKVDYCRQTYFPTKKVAHIQKKLEISGQEVVYYS